MATVTSDLVKTTCAHCEREIPTSNIDLHYVHCSRNLQKCTICGDMVPTKLADEHYRESHAPIDCSLCGEAVEREAWTLHKGERCKQRMVTCEYCEFPLPAVDLYKHQEICGNRTEYCQTCSRYVRLREQIAHEIQFHGNQNGAAESSRDARPTARPAEREEDAHRRPPQNSPKGQILFTIAITGIAVLIGSIFLQQGKAPEQ